MNDECIVEEIITKFLLNTCRLRPHLNIPAAQAAMRSALLAARHPKDEFLDVDVIPLTTGSVAEFYIEPMLRHIGDIDVMYHLSTELAIPRGHPPPTQLPAEFHNYVKVYEIIDSHLPGYVYVIIRYLLTECVDDGKYIGRYNFVEYDEQKYLSNGNTTANNSVGWHIHGPARQFHFRSALPCDRVLCMRCLVWPSQAADWPTRLRNYGWPDSATVDRVVNNGCDVVGVAHRQCRQQEWMGMNQWRLSFSRAEIVLINSWMPVQQTVYHVLRVFMNIELLTNSVRADNSEAGTLSNYHIKTLMLWACELKSRQWWTYRLNLVKTCIQLLHILGNWLTDARCQHYFINNCNLIDNSFDVTNIGDHLTSIDATWLSTWFVHKYIRKCSELCPSSIAKQFDDVNTSIKLQNAVSSAIVWRLTNTPLDLLYEFNFIECQIVESLCAYPLTASLCASWMTQLAKIDSRLHGYFSAMAFLHVAYRLSRYGLNDELMDTLATLFGQLICKRRYCNNSTTLLSLEKATKLIRWVANKSLSTMSVTAIELSKAYLLKCTNSDNDNSYYCLANVYLAVLYYTTRQYEKAIDHCTLVMRSQDHSQCSSHVVQGELVLSNDDNTDRMLGLAVFYQHVRTTALNQQCQAKQDVIVLTTELVAYYMHM